MKNYNPILISDTYKYTHWLFMRPNTHYISSYMEARGSDLSNEIVYYGGQYYIDEYLTTPFTQKHIKEAREILQDVFGKDLLNIDMFNYILKEHKGFYPVQIKALPEGTVVPNNVKMMDVVNYDKKCAPVTNMLETLLLNTWYPISVATLSREANKIILKYWLETVDHLNGIEYVLNDFGMRGATGPEAAAIGGAAHLIISSGSDTVSASKLLRDYYGANSAFGKSIPATEHMITTQEGEEGELNVFKRVLQAVKEGHVACVSDQYDILRACRDYWGTELRDEILQRNGTLVVRPDSGHVINTLLNVFEILFEKFGYTVNKKGYKVLPPQIRVIQGDGISIETIPFIYEALKKAGISAENLALGMGGKLLQYTNRDTFNMAFKAYKTNVDGVDYPVFKNPIEINDDNQRVVSFKRSKKGDMKTILDKDGIIKTVPITHEGQDLLELGFRGGKFIKKDKAEYIKQRASIYQY